MPTSNHRTLPRQKRSPSNRDQALYLAYRTQGRTQTELAKDVHLSQRRISQILQRVERWLANSPTCNVKPETCNSLDHNQLQRLERQLERERAQAIYDRNLRAFDHGIHELKTTRQGEREGKKFTETTSREVLPSPQLLRVALQANRDLGKIADKPAPPPPPKPQDDAKLRWQQTLSSLYQARQQAESEKKVTQGHGHLDYLGTVEAWLDALLGNRPEYFHPDDSAPGTPLAELANFYPSRVGSAHHSSPVPASTPETHDPESPASPDSACNLEPETRNSSPSPSNPSTASNLTPPASPFELPSRSHAPRGNARPRRSPSFSSSPNPEPRPLNPYTRRLAHDRQLELFREANRRGLPILFEFDPADGPLPSRSYRPADYGYQAPPLPTQADEAQLVTDYLAHLRAEQLANA